MPHNLKLHKSTFRSPTEPIHIAGSKSESNRLLLLQALFPELELANVSNSDDTVLMAQALASQDSLINIQHAGTAMRFLTAFFAMQENKTLTLTGSQRMRQRPIKILVDALNQLGARITYLNANGFPPLQIEGKKLSGQTVTIHAGVSSQYISALLLIGPKLKNGLQLKLTGQITSTPYIQMTLELLHQIGVETHISANTIRVNPLKKALKTTIQVESDWSSASYFYSLIALSPVGAQIALTNFKKISYQGDAALAHIYKQFGVFTSFHNNKITLKKTNLVPSNTTISLHLANTPDIAQTIIVTCLGLGLSCKLTGLHTLKIKETDRLVALKTELEKLGASVVITTNSIRMAATKTILPDVCIATYNDHRMAMAFAPLALRTDLTILDAPVVSKSFPSFWTDLKATGIRLS
ncbi:3-phosphoshikimate 1-carboxyvinyltransferase [Bizionia sediminis]|uniref:3-phosphoshikimate 1-carboxyvinyltransferase n=1 Tax=Bizionia sediminis TaxID=1737064 RepID=A0ABW5KSZ3_9FLAO